jgi:predicted kinase
MSLADLVRMSLGVVSGYARPYRERMATAHLLFGYLGSGKTTFAKHLEVEHRAVRFTPDEWMARLFGDDPPEESFAEKAEAILELLEPLWTRCLSLGVDVVLDYGFWSRKERDEVRAVVERLGASAYLYRLECPDDEARRRIEARNQADDRSLYIAPATYDALWRHFEPLDVDEACLEVDNRTVR